MDVLTKTISNIVSGIGKLLSVFNRTSSNTQEHAPHDEALSRQARSLVTRTSPCFSSDSTQLTMSPVHGTSVNIPEEESFPESLSSLIGRINRFRETPSRLLEPFSRLNIRSSVSATRTFNPGNHLDDLDITPVSSQNSHNVEEVDAVHQNYRPSPEFIVDLTPAPSSSGRRRSPNVSSAPRVQHSNGSSPAASSGHIRSERNRKRHAHPANDSPAPPTQRPRLDNVSPAGTDDELLPCIDGYRLVAHGRVEFHVRWQEDPAYDEWLEECKMNPELHGQLHDYRNSVSGVHYYADDNFYPLDKILHHRFADDGTIIYFVSWSGEWTHPVWRSELLEATVREKSNEMCEQYNKKHRL